MDKIQEIEEKETVADTGTRIAVEKIEKDLQRLLQDIEALKQSQ